MSEQQAKETKKVSTQPFSSVSDRVPSISELYLYNESPAQHNQRTHQLECISNTPSSHKNTPQWLLPFLSLRTQLALAYVSLIIIIVLFAYLIFNHANSPLATAILIVALIAFGGIIAFGITSYLLQPLLQVTDATQAIAAGDLKQRDRLLVRLPPQDEIDRLSGCIHTMSWRLEHAEAQLEASQEQFRQFFSDASHQLRTPLTSIRGFTELLLRGAKDDPDTSQRILTRMKNESERMTLLINDLLTVARLNDTHPLKLQYLDLVEMAVEGVTQAQKRANDGRKIILDIATLDHLGIQADRERIQQLIFILLDNALKYGKAAPSGEITLRLNKYQGKAELYVIDNGEGIVREDLEHIFDAFYRGRHRSSTNAQIIGTGLGLTIASAIARSHNGSIHVCSEPGNTEFKVLIPCMD